MPQQALLVEAALQLGWARLELRLFHFQRIAARLGAVLPADAPQTNRSGTRFSDADRAAASDIGWAVRCAARNVPFRAVCLPQAIAAKKMLARRGVNSVLHFGVAQGLEHETALVAHAWLDAVGVEITGYPVASRFKEVARFA